MKRLLCVFCALILLAGCGLLAEKERQITFRLEELENNECVWHYFIQPEGALQKVRDEIAEGADGLLYHEWLFEGVQAGDVSVTFQYIEEGREPERTVTYTCFVDENLHVGLLETVDSKDLVGTAEDELLLRCVSTIVALDIGKGLSYPTEQVESGYVSEFLLYYANLFCSDDAEVYQAIQNTEYEQYITQSKAEVEELLSIAFGSRFGEKQLEIDENQIVKKESGYYFARKDTVEVVAASVGEETEKPEYIFTLIGDEESVDGSARVTTKASPNNRTGREITSVTVQKNE